MKILIFTNAEEILKRLKEIISKKYPEYLVESIRYSRDVDKIRNIDFDIVFIDDKLSENNTAAAIYIQKMLPESNIILLSDSVGTVSDLLLNIIPFGVIDKPVSSTKIYKYLNAVRARMNKSSERFVFTEKGRKRNLQFSNIIYLESNREKLLIKTVRSAFSIWMKMSEAETQFPDYFVRCHNSFLVNMKFVIGYESNSFKLINGQEIIVSRSKKEETMEKFYAFKDMTR